MLDRTYIDLSVKIELAKKLNVCACNLNKMDKRFSDYSALDSIILSEFLKSVYNLFIEEVPNIDIREMSHTESLTELAYYIQTKSIG